MSGFIGDLFWVIMLFVIFLPLLQQKMMHGKRMAVIRALERKRNSRVITLIHRQETMKFLGFPVMRCVTSISTIPKTSSGRYGLPLTTCLST